FNISADLAGMADAIDLLVRVPSAASIPALGAGLLAATVYLRYATFARYLKCLTLVLFAYAVAALLSRPEWSGAGPEFHPGVALGSVVRRGAPRHPRNHDLPLPLLLAGLAGGGGGEGARQANPRRAIRSYGPGAPAGPRRRHGGHGALQFRDVL